MVHKNLRPICFLMMVISSLRFFWCNQIPNVWVRLSSILERSQPAKHDLLSKTSNYTEEIRALKGPCTFFTRPLPLSIVYLYNYQPVPYYLTGRYESCISDSCQSQLFHRQKRLYPRDKRTSVQDTYLQTTPHLHEKTKSVSSTKTLYPKCCTYTR